MEMLSNPKFILSQKNIPNLYEFHKLVKSLIPEFIGFNKVGDIVEVELSIEPTVELINQIEAIIPPSVNPLDQVKLIVARARVFGDDIINTFAAENVLMGITQSGKTKAVSDYLANVMRYAQSGSLYEVINEIDTLKSQGIPAELAPFITTERLDTFRLKIVQYLQS